VTKVWTLERWKDVGAWIWVGCIWVAAIFGFGVVVSMPFALVKDFVDLHHDDRLHARVQRTTAKVTEVDKVHVFSPRGGSHDECTPTAVGRLADGSTHAWELTNWQQCDGFYRVGDRLMVAYATYDVDDAGVVDDVIGSGLRNDVRVDVEMLAVGAALLGVGVTGLWPVFHRGRSQRGRTGRNSTAESATRGRHGAADFPGNKA
jgi:hypothetical protein